MSHQPHTPAEITAEASPSDELNASFFQDQAHAHAMSEEEIDAEWENFEKQMAQWSEEMDNLFEELEQALLELEQENPADGSQD